MALRRTLGFTQGSCGQAVLAVVFVPLLLAASVATAREPGDPLEGLLLRWRAGNSFYIHDGYREFGKFSPSSGLTSNDSSASTEREFGDIDGDGRLDQIDEYGILLGHGDGVFGIQPTAFQGPDGRVGMSLGLADFDRDGRADVVMGLGGGVGVRVYFGRSDGTLEPGPRSVESFRINSPGRGLELVDLDGDGFEDLLALGFGGPVLAYGSGDGSFELTDESVPWIHRGTEVDLEGDGLIDFVTVGRVTGEAELPENALAVHILTFGRDRRMSSPRRLWVGGTFVDRGVAMGVTVGDVNRDGVLDILAGAWWGELSLFMGRGDGTFDEETTVSLPVDDLTSSLLLEDLDSDGLLDLAVSYDSQDMEVYWGVEDGFFDFERPTLTGNSRGAIRIEPLFGMRRAFIRGDANQDGGVDISDALLVLNQLFDGAAMVCGDASDVDDSAEVELTDAIYLLLHLVAGGPPPPRPYPRAGGDWTWDVKESWSQGASGELGCSFETFNSRIYHRCPVGQVAGEFCKYPVRQVIDPGDLGPGE